MPLSIVAFMPMRHSSERVPGKNYRDFNGRPLFHHALSTLLAVPQISAVVIDTDSRVIAEQCAEFFPEVRCIERPEHLLGGETPMTDVLRHDAAQFPSEWYLQTHSTNPLLRASTIEDAIERLVDRSTGTTPCSRSPACRPASTMGTGTRSTTIRLCS